MRMYAGVNSFCSEKVQTLFIAWFPCSPICRDRCCVGLLMIPQEKESDSYFQGALRAGHPLHHPKSWILRLFINCVVLLRKTYTYFMSWWDFIAADLPYQWATCVVYWTILHEDRHFIFFWESHSEQYTILIITNIDSTKLLFTL